MKLTSIIIIAIIVVSVMTAKDHIKEEAFYQQFNQQLNQVFDDGLFKGEISVLGFASEMIRHDAIKKGCR